MSALVLTPLVHVWTRIGRYFLGGNYGHIPPPGPQPEEHTLDIGDTRVSFLRWPCDAPTLLLLHGLNNNAWAWARVAYLLHEKRDVISVCLRGHGQSFAPERGYSLKETAADIVALLDFLNIDEIELGGHSWGGKVATYLAATNPKRVKALILADPVPPAGLNLVLRTFPALVHAALLPERGHYKNHDALEAAGRALPYLWAFDRTDRLFWFSSFVQVSDGTFRHTLPDSGYLEIVEKSFNEDLRPILSAIHCPILWMHPTFSISFLPWEPDMRVWQCITVRHVSGDHQFIHTNPLDTAAIIMEFLGCDAA